MIKIVKFRKLMLNSEMLKLTTRSTSAYMLQSSGMRYSPHTASYRQLSIQTLKTEVLDRFSTCLTKLKIKSDRLNALRKQYDSFIEEDKKRKERNDSIIQRLDQICSSATSAPLRSKTIYGEYVQPYDRYDYKQDKMKLRDDFVHTNHSVTKPNLQLDIARHFDDISILREISKKYILIPKSKTAIFNNLLATNVIPQENKSVQHEPQSDGTDNNDWRSKYDILEQLKKKEKEENINKTVKEEINLPPTTQFYHLEPEMLLKNIINDNGSQNITYDGMLAKQKAEIPEKDLPDDNLGNELEVMNNLKISNIVREELVTNITQPSSDIESNMNYTSVFEEPVVQTQQVENDVLDTHYTNNNIPVFKDVSYQPPNEQINILYEENKAQEKVTDIGNNQTNVYQDYPNHYEPVVEPIEYEENKLKENEKEYSPISVPTKTLQELNTAAEVDVNQVNKNPVDIRHVQDFTPANNVELHNGVNINPEHIATNQEVNLKSNEEKPVPINESNINQQDVVVAENNADNLGINTFDDTEIDNNMLYEYDQEDTGEPYDPEYVPEQAYPPNTDYNYYENQQENVYPVEINEHEETSERYDPNYEQQFVTNYDGFDTIDQQEPIQQYEQQPTEGYQEPIQQYEQQPTEGYQEPAPYEQNEEDYAQYNYEAENKNITEDVARELDDDDKIINFVQPDQEVLRGVSEVEAKQST